MPNAEETLWNCRGIDMEHVSAQGDYFAMNSHGIRARDFSLDGNYSFDGASDIILTMLEYCPRTHFGTQRM